MKPAQFTVEVVKNTEPTKSKTNRLDIKQIYDLTREIDKTKIEVNCSTPVNKNKALVNVSMDVWDKPRLERLNNKPIDKSQIMALTAVWYPSIKEGRFHFVRNYYVNIGCVKINATIITYIFYNGREIYSIDTLDSTFGGYDITSITYPGGWIDAPVTFSRHILLNDFFTVNETGEYTIVTVIYDNGEIIGGDYKTINIEDFIVD